jgi:putative spermidine/putrescine transport system substrate-binding protein
MARIKVMVDTGNVDWDVVQIEGPDLLRGCDEGMYERLDWNKLGHKDQLIADAAQECGSAALVWSVAIAYDRDKLAQAPTSWADFWDVKKYPGKRGLRKRAVYNLEFALLADGVKVEDVYKVLATPAGVDRAFAKLSQLKPYIQWWEAGRPAAAMADGRRRGDDLDLQRPHRRRRTERQPAGAGVARQPVRHGLLGDHQGLETCEQAERLIAFANQPEAQVRYVEQIPYGPTNTQAAAALAPELAKWVPTSPEP